MTFQHPDLSLGRWGELPLCEQMANIGSEVCRAINWHSKGNEEMSRKASVRALELLDFSLDSTKSLPRLREFARLREAVVDYFYGSNQFSSSEASWRRYFDHFNYAARRDR